MVEQWTHKPLVVGSNPTLATKTENRQFWRFFGFFIPVVCSLYSMVMLCARYRYWALLPNDALYSVYLVAWPYKVPSENCC